MPTQSWTTKTELSAGVLSGNAVLVGTETNPILSIFKQDIYSVDTDIHLTYTGFTLSSDFVPVNNQIPGISTGLNLSSDFVPVNNQIPGITTAFNLSSDFVPTNNQIPSLSIGDVSSFKSTGNFDVLKSDMKITWVV